MMNPIFSALPTIPCVIVATALAFVTQANAAPRVVIDVDPSHFIEDALVEPIKIEMHTLSGGTEVECYVIKTLSIPHEHEMGPWAPKTINDDKDAGGIWFKDGKVYDVDGLFVKNVAELYNDQAWKLYRDDGTVKVTETKAAFEAAARPDVAAEFNNYVVEGNPEWVEGMVTTYIIPVTPVYADQPALLGGGGGRPGGEAGGRPPRGERPEGRGRPDGPPPGGRENGRGGGERGGAGQGGVGLAFNGVNYDPPAPVDAILAAHTIAPFDDAGGHLNPYEGYHYHAATGHTKEIAQPDGHAPMIGYALDGFGIYAHLDENGNPPADLDACQGHYDNIRGYHYHAGAPADNQILKGFRGETGSVSVKD